MTEGVAEQVSNHGTVVVLFVREEGGGLQPIYFDHRPFRDFAEATGLRPGDRVRFDPETNTVEVLS